ncbi:MAG: GT2 family glycosyltransferase [Cyclobacteriaceae bacterium]|jgi:GT2 family glycosyltransferase
MSKVSIITVNYNEMAVTLELLNSIGSFDPILLEVIVIDNGSSTDETKQIRSKYPNVLVIRSEYNLGFAGGNNLGIKEATGDYLFFLNNDTVLSTGTTEKLCQVLDQNASLGVVSPLIFYADQPDILQYGGFSSINPFTGRNKALHYKQAIKCSEKQELTSYAHGAAMMIKREAIDSVGPMPETYFLYYEELEWIHRIKKNGYQVFVDHSSHIYHKESIATGKNSPLKTYFQTRNRILFMRRNFGLVQQVMFFVFFSLLAAPKQVLTFIVQQQSIHLVAYLKACIWHLQNGTESTHLGFDVIGVK